MSLNIKTTTNIDDPANFVVSSILKQLKLGKKVLFFVTGGSSISVGVRISEILRDQLHNNLTVMMTDERYGPIDSPDSNWYQLIQKGFTLPQAKLIPILFGNDRTVTTEKFKENLKRELENADYKISLFGIGLDGHTAGILPETVAVTSPDLACGYDTSTFSRVTITSKVIEKLDEAIAWVQGEDKWRVIQELENEIDIIKQPAQILKKIPLLTIFTDYQKD
jgi:6-phosphogluconolactonase/glucosamine-6-phosphate isomerase/deaminase